MKRDAAIKIVKQADTLSISNNICVFDFSLKTGSFSGKDIQSGITVFEDARFSLDELQHNCWWSWKQPEYVYEWSETPVSDCFGLGKTLCITHIPQQGYRPICTLKIIVYEDKPFIVFGFGIINQFDYPVLIPQVLLINEAKLFNGRKITVPQTLRGGAGSERQFVENTLDVNAYNSVMLTCNVNERRHTMVVGGLKYKEYFRHLMFSSESQTIKVSCEDPQGKYVAPKTTYNSDDTVFLDFVTVNPFTSLENYGLAMRQANNAKPNMYNFPTLCGWMVSNKDLGEGKSLNNSPGLVEQTKLAKETGIMKYTPIAVRLEPDYYCHKNYGDTQQGWWDNEHWAKYGSLLEPYETFGKFCKAVSELGGIVLTYFQCSMPSNDFAIAHPEWMLNNDISLLCYEHRPRVPYVRYDYTEPEFQKYILNMWKRLRSEGVRGIKFDYPETAWAKNGGFEDKSYTTTLAYRTLFALCRQGMGKDALIHERNLGEEETICVDVTAGIVDLQRVWEDSSHFEPEMVSRIGLRWYKNRVVFNYYPDGKSLFELKTKKPLPTEYRRTMLTLIGLLSGRLELGTSFGSMTKDMLYDVTRLYPVLEEPKSFRPVDMLLCDKHPQVYVYDINTDWSQIILCNNNKEEREISVPLSGNQCETGSLGMESDKEYYIYDFWNNKLIGKYFGNKKLSVKLGGCQSLVYSVHKVSKHPQFISTNRHIMQGYMELHNVQWNQKESLYSGLADVIADETMEIIIALNGHTLKKAEVDSGTVKMDLLANGLMVMKIDSKENKSVKWTLVF